MRYTRALARIQYFLTNAHKPRPHVSHESVARTAVLSVSAACGALCGQHAVVVSFLGDAALLLSVMSASLGGALATYLYACWVAAIYLLFAMPSVATPAAVARLFGRRHFVAVYGLVYSGVVRPVLTSAATASQLMG